MELKETNHMRSVSASSSSPRADDYDNTEGTDAEKSDLHSEAESGSHDSPCLCRKCSLGAEEEADPEAAVAQRTRGQKAIKFMATYLRYWIRILKARWKKTHFLNYFRLHFLYIWIAALIGGTILFASQETSEDPIQWLDGLFFASSSLGQDGKRTAVGKKQQQKNKKKDTNSINT